jgi:hypothetical protein
MNIEKTLEMADLVLNKTEKTPSIEFKLNGELRIEGRSIPENSIGFYEVPIAWLSDFRHTRPAKVNLHVNLEYFNTSSGKLLLSLFRQIELLKLDGADAKIFWYYNENDSDMSEAGQDFESIVKLPFKYVQLV